MWGLRQSPLTLKPLLVDVKYAVVYTAHYVFIFPQECHNIHMKARSSQIYNTLTRHRGKLPPTASTWEGAFNYGFFSCLSNSCLQTNKKWQSCTVVSLQSELPKLWGDCAAGYRITFLHIQSCRKELGFLWREKAFSVARKGDTLGRLPKKEPLFAVRIRQTKGAIHYVGIIRAFWINDGKQLLSIFTLHCIFSKLRGKK